MRPERRERSAWRRGEKIPEKELTGPIRAEFKITKKQEDTTIWTGGRFSVGGGLIYNRPDRSYGYSGYFAFDQGLDRAIGKRHPFMPGIRFEAGYSGLVKPYHTYYSIDQPASLDPTLQLIRTKYSHKISGVVTGLGLMWAFPSLRIRGAAWSSQYCREYHTFIIRLRNIAARSRGTS